MASLEDSEEETNMNESKTKFDTNINNMLDISIKLKKKLECIRKNINEFNHITNILYESLQTFSNAMFDYDRPRYGKRFIRERKHHRKSYRGSYESYLTDTALGLKFSYYHIVDQISKDIHLPQLTIQIGGLLKTIRNLKKDTINFEW